MAGKELTKTYIFWTDENKHPVCSHLSLGNICARWTAQKESATYVKSNVCTSSSTWNDAM